MDGTKSGRLRNLFYDILLVAGVGLLLWGGGNALRKYLGEEKDRELYQQLNEEFVNQSTESEEKLSIVWGAGNGDVDSASAGMAWYRRNSVDFDGLNAINPDVVGWLFFENEDISYPILYSGDDDYYLHRTLYKQYSESGSIFMEGENEPDLLDEVTILYGHNMKNSSMFGKLRYYKEQEGYYEDHQYFQVLTEDGRAYRYRVFSYFDVDQYEVGMVDVEFYDSENPATARTQLQSVDNSSEIRKLEERIRDRRERAEGKFKEYEEQIARLESEAEEAETESGSRAQKRERKLASLRKKVQEEEKALDRQLRQYEKEIAKLRGEKERVITNLDNTYENYLDTLQERSLRQTDVSVEEEDRVVGLYTCSSDKGNRLSVYGVLVAEHDFNEILEEDPDIRTLDR